MERPRTVRTQPTLWSASRSRQERYAYRTRWSPLSGVAGVRLRELALWLPQWAQQRLTWLSGDQSVAMRDGWRLWIIYKLMLFYFGLFNVNLFSAIIINSWFLCIPWRKNIVVMWFVVLMWSLLPNGNILQSVISPKSISNARVFWNWYLKLKLEKNA